MLQARITQPLANTDPQLPTAQKAQREPWLKPIAQTSINIAQTLWRFVQYILSFQWVVDCTHYLLRVGGTIAESAFVLSTTYVIISLVAHPLVLWIVHKDTDVIDTANQVALIAFSALPELIIISALVKCYEQWRLIAHKNYGALLWAACFTVPTSIFVYVTIHTILGFVTLQSTNLDYKISGFDLQLRVLTGWAYGITHMLYRSHVQPSIEKKCADLCTIIETKSNDLLTLNQRCAELEQQLLTMRVHNAQRKIKSPQPTAQPIAQLPQRDTQSAQMDKDRTKLTMLIRTKIVQGDKLNWKQVAGEAKISYAKVRRLGPKIVKQITEELSNEQQVVNAD